MGPYWRTEPGQHERTGRKVSEHPDLFKTLKNIIDLSLAESCPCSSLLPIYPEGSLSDFSAYMTFLYKLHRDQLVFLWKTMHCLHMTHTSRLSDF